MVLNLFLFLFFICLHAAIRIVGLIRTVCISHEKSSRTELESILAFVL